MSPIENSSPPAIPSPLPSDPVLRPTASTTSAAPRSRRATPGSRQSTPGPPTRSPAQRHAQRQQSRDRQPHAELPAAVEPPAADPRRDVREHPDPARRRCSARARAAPSASAAAYSANPPDSIANPSSQLWSPSSSRREWSGRRIDSVGSAAAASCSRRYARFASVVDPAASGIAIAVPRFTAATVASVRIATWNVNSVKQRLPRLLPWLDERRPDVVCLQETKLADDAFAELLGRRARRARLRGRRPRRGGVERGRDPVPGGARRRRQGLPGEPGFPDPEARAVSATCGGIRVISVYVPNGRRARLRALQVQARVARRAARDGRRGPGGRRSCAAT